MMRVLRTLPAASARTCLKHARTRKPGLWPPLCSARRRGSRAGGNTRCGIISMAWIVETLNGTVDAELAALPDDVRARFVRIAELIEDLGLTNVGAPHVRHLRGPIWEMRLSGRSGIARALYVAARGQRVVVVRVFVKKTERIPAREIGLALWRAKELWR